MKDVTKEVDLTGKRHGFGFFQIWNGRKGQFALISLWKG